MKRPDPEGLYAALNVSPDASQQEIRLAYTFLKQAYKSGNRSLKIGRVRQAYKTLGTPATRKRYDDGKRSPLARFTRPDGTTPLHSLPLLIGLLLATGGVTAFTLGPTVRAWFVTFDAGQQLYWKETGRPLGTVLQLAPDHEFAQGRRGRAYQIDLGAGNEPVWLPANDLARNCFPR